jgi:hypothetical protein
MAWQGGGGYWLWAWRDIDGRRWLGGSGCGNDEQPEIWGIGGGYWLWAWRNIDGRRWLGAVDVKMMSNQRVGEMGVRGDGQH